MPRHPSLRRLPFAALIAASIAVPGAVPATAQEWVMRAFGDSITEGYGDLSSFNGYPARLERRFRQSGYDVTVTEHGVGGETTAQGLNRIDEVLALGGDYLLLMEGTNDISHHTGVETMRFNLDEMAMRAEALGMVAVHATVIPRIPTANTDANNAKTSALAAAILEMGFEELRPVADIFHEFESLPNLYEDFYFYDDSVPDPVGHPNNAGYIVIAGIFFETIRPYLDGPMMQIDPPSGPLATGAAIDFSVVTNGAIVRVEWSFGDGGFAFASEPPGFDATYAWAAAGAYTVRATGYAPDGEAVTDEVQVQVAGPAPAWGSRTLLLPAVASPVDEMVVSDLELGNASASPGIAVVRLLADIDYDTAPPARRLFVPAGGDLIVEFLPRLFGVEGARGGAVVELIGPAAAASLSAEALVRAPHDDNGSDGCSTGSQAQASWSAAPKQILGITIDTGEVATFHVVNPGASAGTVRLDLYDALSSYVGSAIFDVAAGRARERELDDLFRGLASRPEPLRAVFTSSGVPFSAYLVTADGDEVRCAGGTP